MNKRLREADWETLQDAHARTSLSISELFRRCIAGDIVSSHMVKPGKTKGVRLINRKSLDDYIRSFMPGGSRYHGRGIKTEGILKRVMKYFGPAPADADENDVYIDTSDWSEERVERLLLYSTLSSLVTESWKEKSRKVKAQLTKFTAYGMLMGTNTQGFLRDVKPTDLSRDLNFAIVGSNADYPNDPTKFVINHAFKLRLQQARIGGLFSSYPVGISHYFIDTVTEKAELYPTIIAHYKPVKGAVLSGKSGGIEWPKNWQNAQNHQMSGMREASAPYFYTKAWKEHRSYDSKLNGHINTLVSLQFSSRYDWYVLIGFEDLPKLQVFVDLDVIPELFDLRKVKENDGRRGRLIHWVIQHLRRKPGMAPDEEKTVRVCEHLRGKYEFEWDGLNCWLIPSEFDRERLPQHTKHAEIW